MRRPGWRTVLVAAWGLALVIQGAAGRSDQASEQRGAHAVWVGSAADSVRIALVDERPGCDEVLLLIHGSPGSASNFDALRARLPDSLRVLAVDLPGFGGSTRALDDYSFTRQAKDLLLLLDRLNIEQVHVVGMSMGGGVALEMVHRAPARVASLTLLSSIGFQEYELTGDYWTNHALHAVQVGLVWAIEHLVPHFGLLHSGGEAWSYARNFYDSDQRRLEDPLLRWEGPTLILHGDQDFLVPVEAARASAAAMPQARLEVVAGEGHFMLWTEPALLATRIADFVADPGDRPGALADHPRTAPPVPPVTGPGRWIQLGLAAASAAVSGFLASWWFAGLGVAGLVPAPALLLALAVGAGSGGLLPRSRRRLATAAARAAAVALQAGALLGLGRVVGVHSPAGFVLAAVLWLAGSLAWQARSRPARRRLRGRWLRWSRWEYWPAVAIYLSVIGPLLWRSRAYGGPRSVTCVNPALPLGGLVGESKSAILVLLGEGNEIPRWSVIGPGELADRRRAAEAFAATLPSPWPLVLKPDRGERGQGVTIAWSPQERDEALSAIGIDLVVQEYVEGPEYGIFWYRRSPDAEGTVYSITAKRPVEITGDGARRVVDLLLDHDRVVPLLDLHLHRHADRLGQVLGPGERMKVTELGTHCLGATFLDVSALVTPALAAALDRIMDRAPGLDFGRFDLRAPSESALREGRGLKVLEFNGLSAEAVHMYDPSYGFAMARRTLIEQWTLALQIGSGRRRAGNPPASWTAIGLAWWRHRAERDLRRGRR